MHTSAIFRCKNLGRSLRAPSLVCHVRAPFPLGRDEMWPPSFSLCLRRSEIGGGVGGVSTLNSQLSSQVAGRFYERATKMDGSGTDGLRLTKGLMVRGAAWLSKNLAEWGKVEVGF